MSDVTLGQVRNWHLAQAERYKPFDREAAAKHRAFAEAIDEALRAARDASAEPAINGYTCTVPDDCETLHWRGQILSMNELASMAQPAAIAEAIDEVLRRDGPPTPVYQRKHETTPSAAAVWPDTRARPAASALRFVKAAIVLGGIALAHVWWACVADPRWVPAVITEGLFAAVGALFCGLWSCTIPPVSENKP